MKHVITIIMTLAITASTHAFVLMGPTPDQDEYTLNTGNAPNFVYIAIAERFNDGGVAIQLKTGCELDQFANR